MEADRTTTLADLIDRLEHHYAFQCAGGPLGQCREWEALKAAVLGEKASAQRLDSLADVLAEMKYRAEEGCTGSHDGTCCDPEMEIHPEEWCHRCLMGAAAKAALDAAALTAPVSGASPSAQGQQRCRVCGGYGFIAQKQCIDDGYGEVDSCQACDDRRSADR